MLKDGGRLSVRDDLLVFAWFCVCKLGGSLAGLNVSFVVMAGACTSALGDNRRVCVEVV
jgi:hypothetical protein